MTKSKQTIHLSDTTLQEIENIKRLDITANSKSLAVEKAIAFYSGYLQSNDSQDYLMDHVARTILSNNNRNTNRIMKTLFNSVIEINVLSKIISSSFKIPIENYKKLRDAAVKDIKQDSQNLFLSEMPSTDE